MPSRSSLSARERAAYSRIRKLLNEPNLLRGNTFIMSRVCGKKKCSCREDPDKKHRSLYLSMAIEGKRKLFFVPKDWEENVIEWTARYAEVRDLLNELSMKTLERFQNREE